MIPVEVSFVLEMMLKAEPKPTPWRDTYASTAQAVANSANKYPLFSGEDGPARSAAVAVAVMWFESHLDPKAKGDGKCLEYQMPSADELEMRASKFPGIPVPLKCKKKGPPQSFCAFQVGVSNFKFLGVTEETILGDIQVCSDAGFRMMNASFGLCRERPLDERLTHYAAGGSTCTLNEDATRKSKHRMAKALWLFKNTRDES